MTSSVSTISPRDSKMMEEVVDQLKANGVFDQLRRDCLADVDTKPAYQNLRQRVEGYVSNFLAKQIWRPDLNKNQLRDQLRRQINQSGMLLTGVDRVIDQVVNPKIYHLFKPEIEKVVYAYLGIEKSKEIPQPVPPPPLPLPAVQATNIVPPGPASVSPGGIYPSYSSNQNVSYPNYSVTSSPLNSFNNYSTYNQSPSSSYSPYKQPPAAISQSQPYTHSGQSAYSYSVPTFNSTTLPSTVISHGSETPEKKDTTSISIDPALGMIHQRKDFEIVEHSMPVSKCNDILDRKEPVKNDPENFSMDISIVRKNLSDFENLSDREFKEDQRPSRIETEELHKNDKGKEQKFDRKSNFELGKSKSVESLSKSCENKDIRSMKVKSSSFERHHSESPKGKSVDYFKNKSPVKSEEKIKTIEDKIKSNDLKHKSKINEDKNRSKSAEEIRTKHSDTEIGKNKQRTPEDFKIKIRLDENKLKSTHKDETKIKHRNAENSKQKMKNHEEDKSKNKSSDSDKQKHTGNDDRNKLKLSGENKVKEEKIKNEDKSKSSMRGDKLKLFKSSKSKSNGSQESKFKTSSSEMKLTDKLIPTSKSEGKLSFESQICYDNKTLLDIQYTLDKTKVIQTPVKKHRPEKLNLNLTKNITATVVNKAKPMSIDKNPHKEDIPENKNKLKQNNKGSAEKVIVTLENKHQEVAELSDADSLAGWSDITVSSVHTSDLSSFDEEVTLTSSDEDEEIPRLTEEKIKNQPMSLTVEGLKSEVLGDSHVQNGQQMEQKVKPKRLISLMGRYSDSDDEETKEEKRARMAAEKERRAERRAKLREKLEEKLKQTESIMAKIKESKDKKQSFGKHSVAPPSKPEEKTEEKKKKRIGTSSIKETLKQHKVIEKKMALRRQRKINRRYISDEYYFPKCLGICNVQSSSQDDEKPDVPSDLSQIETSGNEKLSSDSSSKRSGRTLLTLNVKEESKIDSSHSPVESLPPTPTQDEQFFPHIPKQDQDSNIPIVEIQTPIPTYLGKLSQSNIPVIYTDHSSQIVDQRSRKSFKRHNEISHANTLSFAKSGMSNSTREDECQRTKMNLTRRQSFLDSTSNLDRLSKSKARNLDSYTSQRYDDSDLYKPRPIIPSSRRSRGSPPPQPAISQSNQSYIPERKRSRYSPPSRNLSNLREIKHQDDDRGRMSHTMSSQRYDTSDLYKPRPTNSGRSSRFGRRDSPPRKYKRTLSRDDNSRGLNHDKRSHR